MNDPYQTSMMENLYWWGIPTLFRCPNERPEGKDIALVGVPHSTGNGTTERDQHLRPPRVAQCLGRIAAGARGVSVEPLGGGQGRGCGRCPVPPRQ